MKENYYVVDENENNNSFNIKEVINKYLHYWPWFAGSLLIAIVIAFLYFRYAPTVYATEAKIKIIDDSNELDIANEALSILGGGSNINLDNEIEVLQSYKLLEQVVSSLNLDIRYYEVGNIKTRRIFKPPFKVVKLFPDKKLKKSITYKIDLAVETPVISNSEGIKEVIHKSILTSSKFSYPVQIQIEKDFELEDFNSSVFEVKIITKKEAVLNLLKDLKVKPTTKNSEVLSISLQSDSPELSEAVLDEIIVKFDQDGILDRQLVSKRTIDFIDERFGYLTDELDSIESGKKDFKQSNNLSYIEADAGLTMQKKSETEREVFALETQVALSDLLKKNLSKDNTIGLLPADIGLESNSINNLVSEYNVIALQREKLNASAGSNNPTVKVLTDQLERFKRNIITTVDSYQDQLEVSLNQLKRENYRAGSVFSKLPEKEKMLRAIERQQSIKENLFLLLLQKREEAAITYAVTAPSIKVVDYGLTGKKPISPKKPIILIASVFLGLAIPFIILFLRFSLDTKVENKTDLEKLALGIPILAEIPSLENPDSFFTTNERSVKAESFRILGSNVNYLLPKKVENKGSVIYVTSSIKGEGKTLIALNLSIAISSLKKNVLLVGADLRNPQLHNYFQIDKNVLGLSNYLHNTNIKWNNCIQNIVKDNNYLDICFSGPIPPNATQLLASERYGSFLELAKDNYDFVIIDTAPLALVADTLLISDFANITLCITRAAFTDKQLIKFSKGLSEDNKLKNMAYILNDVKFKKRGGYNYGYEYGYGALHSNKK
ncbi:polysaccharide biosynthesis tyrosine autokinase [Aquimarina sp. ERC-38]|uniref:GumC family protein n=1 Tax=Aquimarina sp. ERC-38 TaxID=2949996 RepID=UPI002245C0B1|nr:tyrosine-protein kinase family protein [Aquimarina sp. ERC-38]UZO81455.1 polysaccharide biosynthesis tyrosine autokinase [Aquimarina sp. ERC-38]